MAERQVSLAGVRLTIAIPAYDGKLLCKQVHSLMAAHQHLSKIGVPVTLRFAEGCSLVPVARNMLVHEFLADRDQTHLLFLDSDILFAPGDLVRLVAMATFHDCVSGVYPAKTPEPRFYAVPLEGESGEIPQCSETGLLAHDRVPAGFLCLSRAMLEKMAEAYPDRSVTPRHGPHAGQKMAALFDTMIVSQGDTHEYWGEDFAFCKLWRDLGGIAWVDPTIRLQHVGTTSFDASYLEHLFGQQPNEGREAA